MWIIVRQRFERLLLPGRIAQCMFMRIGKAEKREKSRGGGKGRDRKGGSTSFSVPPSTSSSSEKYMRSNNPTKIGYQWTESVGTVPVTKVLKEPH